MRTLLKLLRDFDIDMFADFRDGRPSYTVRVWDQGDIVSQGEGDTLQEAIDEAYKNVTAPPVHP